MQISVTDYFEVTTMTKPLTTRGQSSLKFSLTDRKKAPTEIEAFLLIPNSAYRSQQLVPVAVNDRFVFDAVAALLLDDRGTVSRLAFLNHCGAIPIAVTIIVPVTFSDCNAGTNRTNPNAHIIRESRCRDSSDSGNN
jgi:hypothetical protein